MLYLRKLMIENKISIDKLAKNINLPFSNLQNKLALKVDFLIEELEEIKNYFIKRQILDESFDIGLFLNLI